MIGDVIINFMVFCFVMIIEILRSMFYRGFEVMREVVWVIFDEIYYMRDLECGVVWEEIIILFFDNVYYVFFLVIILNV